MTGCRRGVRIRTDPFDIFLTTPVKYVTTPDKYDRGGEKYSRGGEIFVISMYIEYSETTTESSHRLSEKRNDACFATVTFSFLHVEVKKRTFSNSCCT